MSDCRDSGVERDAVPTFEDLWQADAQRRREQNRRFQEYISESDPSLAAALAAEAKRFEMVSRAVIEPTMRGFSDEVRQSGWHASVVLDDDLDRLALLATPGIRFYCSRRPTYSATGEPLRPLCFVGFYGSARNLAVATHVELSWVADGAVPTLEPLLEYPEVTNETVRAVLVAFLEDLSRLG